MMLDPYDAHSRWRFGKPIDEVPRSEWVPALLLDCAGTILTGGCIAWIVL